MTVRENDEEFIVVKKIVAVFGERA